MVLSCLRTTLQGLSARQMPQVQPSTGPFPFCGLRNELVFVRSILGSWLSGCTHEPCRNDLKRDLSPLAASLKPWLQLAAAQKVCPRRIHRALGFDII